MGPGSALALLACPGRRGWVRIQFHSHSSSPGLTGRSSIPETLVLEPRGRGVPCAGGDDGECVVLALPFQTYLCLLAARFARGLHFVVPQSKREQGMPGARCTRGLVCKVAQRNAHTSIQVQRRQSGIPCAMALRLMPCSPRRRIRIVTVAERIDG